MTQTKIANVVFTCFIVGVAILMGQFISYDGKKVKAANARLHAACGEERLIATFTDLNKSFVVCAPEYVSSPNDFVVREVK